MHFVAPHELAKDFPQFTDVIRNLDLSDETFHQVFTEYSKIDQDIVNAELENPPMADAFLEQLKFRRVRLKDYLFQRLAAAARASL